MSDDYIPLIVFLLVGSSFAFLLFLSNKRADVEKGLNPIYSARCGGGGDLMASWPFVRLTLYADFLVVSCIGKRVIYYSNIKSVEKAGLINGIRIEPKGRNTYPTTVYAANSKKIIEIIKAGMDYKEEQ